MRRPVGLWVMGLFFASLCIGGWVWATDFVARDRCHDSGGAWYGSLGCEMTAATVDRIIIDKSDRRLFAYGHGRLIHTMPVSLGRSPIGQKQREGDDRTPEGVYQIQNHKADSTYFRALRVSYPTLEQRRTALREGRDPGGDIMIHGIRNGLGWIGRAQRMLDWTRGCIALTDDEILWLYRATRDGVPVEIRP